MTVWLFLALTVSAPAGKKDRVTAPVASPKALESVLEAAGWTIAPERSSTYLAGDIYHMVSNSKVASRADCFESVPEAGSYTSLQVV